MFSAPALVNILLKYFPAPLMLAVMYGYPNLAVCQSIAGSLPTNSYYTYVRMSTAGVSTTQVQTKRVRDGKSEFVDIVNVLADSSFFTQPTDGSLNILLNGPQGRADRLLVTMAVLPDKATGLVTWEPISEDTLKTKPQATLRAVLQDCYVRLLAYQAARPYPNNLTRRLDFRPIIVRAGRRWTTRNTVLTEYFLVRTQPHWFPTETDNVTINCTAKPFSRSEYQALSKQILAAFPNKQKRPILAGELQTKLLLENKHDQIFTFWSIPPTVLDGGINYFGAVELIFKMDVGLLSGKYPNYFELEDDYFDLQGTNITRKVANNFFEIINIRPLSVD